MSESEELELLQLKKAKSMAESQATAQPQTEKPGILGQAWDAINTPVPVLGSAVEEIRSGIPGAIAEATGEISTKAGPLGPVVKGAGLLAGQFYGMQGELLPKTYLDVALTALAGPVGKGVGELGAKMLPPIEARAPNAVRAVRAALSADILPTIPQATQSQAWATAEEVTARIPFFGRRIKAMRQAQESAFQELRTSAVKAAGPSVAPSELGEKTREAVFGQVEAMSSAREKKLATLHKNILKAGGDPTTAEAAARQLDEIRVAKTEEARRTAGKLYDEVAEMVTPDVDKVTDSNIKMNAEKWIKEYKNLPNASLDPKAAKLLEDIRSGPGQNIIENAPDPMTRHAHGQKINPQSQKVLFDAYGHQIDQKALKALAERKTYTFQEAQTLLSTLNGLIQQEYMKAPVGGGTVEGRIYKGLKDSFVEDIKAFGDSLSGDLRDKFDVATAYYRDHYKAIYGNQTMKNLGQLAKEKPKAVFDSLIGRGNVVDIKRLKTAVGKQGFAPMRSLAVERLVTSPEGRILSGPEITKNIAAYGDEALKEILTPKQLAEVSKFRATRELPKFVESEIEKKLKGVIFEREGVFRAPEDVVKRIVNGDTATLKAVKNIVGKSGTDQYRRRIIEDIMGEAYNPTLLPGQVQNPTALRMGKALREYDQSFLNEIFSKKELAEIDKIDDIKALLESQQKLNANPNTAPAAVAMLASGAGGTLMVISPIKGTAALIAADIVSRFYVSEAGRRLMIEGLDPRLVKNMPTYTRIITAAANAARENAREDRINRGVNIK